MQQTEIAELRKADRMRQAQMAETLRVMGDIRREMGDMQTELLALCGHPRRARQPRGDARVPNHQDAPRDADRTKGVVGLTRWIEKMESVFQISGCAIENQDFRPSDTPVCYLCKCEQCGNILNYETCLKCKLGTGHSFTYDPIPGSFDEVQIIPNPPPQFHFIRYLCQICESNYHYGHECSQRVLLVYESKPYYIQNFSDNDYSHDLPGIDPLIDHHCCYKCGNSLNDFFCHQCTSEFCGNGTHIGYNCPAQVPSLQTLPSFPQQYPCCEDCGVIFEADHCQPSQYTVNHPIFNVYNDILNSQTKLMEQLTSMCEMFGQFIQRKHKEEQATNARYWKITACCDDDDDYNFAITTNEPVDSLSIGDEHLNTIPAANDQSCSDEDVSEKIFSNPLFDEEIISLKIDQHHYNAEFDLIESLLNHDSSIVSSSSMIDSLLDEFAGELTLLKSILPRIDETDCDPEEDIRLIERLLYDNLSPRPPKEFVSENSNADIESFSPYPIPVEDSDSFMKEIDLSFTPDDPMPPGIKEDDDDSKRDILILKELFDNYSLSLPEIESYYFDIPSFSRPPAKPPDGNTGILNIKMMGDISKQKAPIPGLMITHVLNHEKSPDLLSHRSLKAFQLSAKCSMMIHRKNIPILDVPLFHFYPLDQLKYGGIGSS
nr:hypothetical protein [Tanacetum cinerariifolium]